MCYKIIMGGNCTTKNVNQPEELYIIQKCFLKIDFGSNDT